MIVALLVGFGNTPLSQPRPKLLQLPVQGRRHAIVEGVEELLDRVGLRLGATTSSEQTTAAEGTVWELRRDPSAMLPFCDPSTAATEPAGR